MLVVLVVTVTMATLAHRELGDRPGGQVISKGGKKRPQSSSYLPNVEAVDGLVRRNKEADRQQRKSKKQKKKTMKRIKQKVLKRPWKKKKINNKKNRMKTCKEKPLQLKCINNKLSQLEAKLKKRSSKKQLKKLEKTMTSKINKAMLNLTAQNKVIQSDLRNNSMKLEASMTKLGMLESNMTAMMAEMGMNWTNTVSIMAEMVESLARMNRTVEEVVVEVGEQGARLAVIEAMLNITSTTAASTTTTTTTISTIMTTSEIITKSTHTDLTTPNRTFTISNATSAAANFN